MDKVAPHVAEAFALPDLGANESPAENNNDNNTRGKKKIFIFDSNTKI